MATSSFQQFQAPLRSQGTVLQQARSRELSALLCLYAEDQLHALVTQGSTIGPGRLS